MDLETENLLWLRVAALRGIDLPGRGARAHLSGDRFQIQVARVASPKTAELERVARLVSDPSCQGVVGEIVARRDDAPPHAPPAPRRRKITSPLGWRGALVEREARRLAGLQPERGDGRARKPTG